MFTRWEVEEIDSSREDEFKWLINEMGNTGDGEFTRRRVQEMGSIRDGQFIRWKVHEIWSSREGGCKR